MQLKTAIIISVLAAISTTTLAAPVNSDGSALNHQARDLEEMQGIEARSPSADGKEIEARAIVVDKEFLDWVRANTPGVGSPPTRAEVENQGAAVLGRLSAHPRNVLRWVTASDLENAVKAAGDTIKDRLYS